MKINFSSERRSGLTLLEAMVVIAIFAVLATLVFSGAASPRSKCKPQRISCVNNLKQIGTAYRIWENDCGDKYPMQQSETEGGMEGLISGSSGMGARAYLPYAMMQNELGQSPKVVICPSDERVANINFFSASKQLLPTNVLQNWKPGTFANTNVSYFVGVGAMDTYPQALLGGDRNLGDAGTTASPSQDPNYGISGITANPTGPCGADVIINTNGQWESAIVAGGGGTVTRGNLVGWSAKMHSAGNSAGAGNILLGDGSAQQCTSANFRGNWLKNAADLGNFAASDKIHSATNGSIRLLIP